MIDDSLKTKNDHQPVLLTEVIESLSIKPTGVYWDATFGRGGHSQAILDRLHPTGRLFALDKDPDAVAYAQKHFANDPRFHIQQGAFSQLAAFAEKQQVYGKIDGILFDLGVSSPQLDQADRGFSFMRNGRLDMRMDNTHGIDAATWLASVDEKTLATVLWEYGEERFSRHIARAIVSQRKEHPITTTHQLAEIISAVLPKRPHQKHPATRSFQAIRMAVNDESQELRQALTQSVNALAHGGRLCVISFHSLEDRFVKQFMKHQEEGDAIPAKLPIKMNEKTLSFKRIGRAIQPTETEMDINHRSRSAVLRIGEKIQ